MLSMDGVQPEKGNETLYVIREVFSGNVLAPKNMKSGAAEELKSLIGPILELGYPIVGIVSDGQHSIRMAFESLLPKKRQVKVSEMRCPASLNGCNILTHLRLICRW
jgi:hypothetical protein